MTVEELLGRVTSRELTEWMALARIEAEDLKTDDLTSTVEHQLAKARQL